MSTVDILLLIIMNRVDSLKRNIHYCITISINPEASTYLINLGYLTCPWCACQRKLLLEVLSMCDCSNP